MNTVIRAFLCCIFLTGVAWGIEVKPTNFSIPSGAGTFSFDFISQSPSVQSTALQITIASITGPSTLTLDPATSSLIKNDSAYWLSGNFTDTTPFVSGSSFVFGDSPNNPTDASLDNSDKIARFAFAWNGTPGNYIFTMNLNSNNSFVNDTSFNTLPMTLPTGTWFSGPITGATSSSFTVNLVPEPVSIVLLGLGGLMALKRRAR